MSHPDRHPIQSALRALSSPRLTVVLLALAIWLVFWATLDYANQEMQEVIRIYFRSFVSYFDFRRGGVWDEATHSLTPAVPVFRMWMPGGYLIGALMLVNLLAAYLTRFRLRWSKAGIHLIHLGVAVILVGELCTGLFSIETEMTIDEGQTTNFSEAKLECELAMVDRTDPGREKHFAIPQSRLDKGAQIAVPGLPFRVEVVDFLPNALLDMRKGGAPAGWEPVTADQGMAGRGLVLRRLARDATMGGRNQPAAFVRLHEGSRCLGTWVVSTQIGIPQGMSSTDGRQWDISLRPRREYKPFSITLRDFQHGLYPGTSIAKDFSSFVTLTEKGLEQGRDVRIWMNHPLRYGGFTFYQSSFANNDTTTVLQVVRNPAWILPYISCSMVFLGLAVQFCLSLAKFIEKNRAKSAQPPPPLPKS